MKKALLCIKSEQNYYIIVSWNDDYSDINRGLVTSPSVDLLCVGILCSCSVYDSDDITGCRSERDVL